MSTAQMDEATRAMCFAYRNPGPGHRPLELKQIQKLLFKKPGKENAVSGKKNKYRPSLSAISQAAANFKKEKKKRGRRVGQRATTKKEDKKLIETFRKLRPPGHAIDSKVLHRGLPKKINKKIGRKTVIRRLAEKGFRASHREWWTFQQQPLPSNRK